MQHEDLYKLRRQSLTLRSSGCRNVHDQSCHLDTTLCDLCVFPLSRRDFADPSRGGGQEKNNNNAFFKRITGVSPCQMLPHSVLRCYQGKKKIYSLLSGPNVIKLH